MEIVRLGAGWVLLAFIALLAGELIYLIARGKKGIDLSHLVSEPTGEASMSRFQLLVFTIVIALSVFYVTVAPDSTGLPEIPTGVLTLLGISASSYAVGKGLQTQRDTTLKQLDKQPPGVMPPEGVGVFPKVPAKAPAEETK
ncbi:MAG TPA: hypothetical protein VJN70_12470 [Gemmatimonadaceae bacterium]|nr:hypothetical protein [Gemmatimonadaceae bacterium]